MIRECPASLKSGETVTLAVVTGPEPEWAGRIAQLLQHKGEPWNWQNGELLRRSTGVGARFFILHRGGAAFASIMLVETAGVGLLGHVWTEPADRRTGASSVLMQRLLEDFRDRGGRALYLITDFDQPPWHYYRRRGFQEIEPGGQVMALFPSGREAFEREWFSGADAVIEPLDWPHWPAAAPLLAGSFPGRVRLAAARAVGCCSSEDTLLPSIREEQHRRENGKPGVARVLRDRAGAAVLGVASCRNHPLWPGMELFDLYCHPAAWHRAPELAAALEIGPGRPLVAYSDGHDSKKGALLAQLGFGAVAVLPRWIASAARREPDLDVVVFVRR